MTTPQRQALAQHVEWNESLVGGDAGVESQKLKLDALKLKLADQKLRLAKPKDSAKRKKELGKASKHTTRQTRAKGLALSSD